MIYLRRRPFPWIREHHILMFENDEECYQIFRKYYYGHGFPHPFANEEINDWFHQRRGKWKIGFFYEYASTGRMWLYSSKNTAKTSDAYYDKPIIT